MKKFWEQIEKSSLPTDPKINLILIVIGFFAPVFGGRALAFPGYVAILVGIFGLIKNWKRGRGISGERDN